MENNKNVVVKKSTSYHLALSGRGWHAVPGEGVCNEEHFMGTPSSPLWGTSPARGEVNGGFTLIELLVVVLIIGILAAIAVPQYKLVVQKTQLAEYRSLANAVAKGAIIYYLANGTWPQNVADLDIELPQLGKKSVSYGGCVYNSQMYCCLTYPIQNGSNGSIICGKKDYSFAYEAVFADSTGKSYNRYGCISKSSLKVCEATNARLGNANANLLTPTGVVHSMRFYLY